MHKIETAFESFFFGNNKDSIETWLENVVVLNDWIRHVELVFMVR